MKLSSAQGCCAKQCEEKQQNGAELQIGDSFHHLSQDKLASVETVMGSHFTTLHNKEQHILRAPQFGGDCADCTDLHSLSDWVLCSL
ncbi:unnamed protein product [Boreogadus saida]